MSAVFVDPCYFASAAQPEPVNEAQDFGIRQEIRIIDAVAAGMDTQAALVEGLGVNQKTISKYLARLVEAGVFTYTVDGVRRRYRIA